MLNTSHLKLHKLSYTCAQNRTEKDFAGNVKISEETRDANKSVAQTEHIRENTELFDKHMEQNLVDTLEQSEEKKKMKMSASRSLDSFQSMEQELYTFDCQGGSEELCEDSKSDDISLDITEDALDSIDEEQRRNNNLETAGKLVENEKQLLENPQLNLVDLACDKVMSKELSHDVVSLNNFKKTDCPSSSEDSRSLAKKKDNDLTNRNLSTTEAKGNQENAVVSEATSIVEFYVNEIEDESHTIMREVLQIAIEFWIKHNLPMENLENVLLRHMSKFFYPLGLLLFW